MEYRLARYLIHRRVSMTDGGGSRRCNQMTAFQDKSMVPDSLRLAQTLPFFALLSASDGREVRQEIAGVVIATFKYAAE